MLRNLFDPNQRILIYDFASVQRLVAFMIKYQKLENNVTIASQIWLFCSTQKLHIRLNMLKKSIHNRVKCVKYRNTKIIYDVNFNKPVNTASIAFFYNILLTRFNDELNFGRKPHFDSNLSRKRFLKCLVMGEALQSIHVVETSWSKS